jgi:hypothetical protein
MTKGTKHYPIRGWEGVFRFAGEFAHFKPMDNPVWQVFYFQSFSDGSKEKKSLPYALKIKRYDVVEEVTIIAFIHADNFTSELFTDYNHLTIIALIDLPTKERVLIPCF